MKEMATFEAKISNVTPMNPTFSTCDIQVMYHGENRNQSIISKEVVEKAIPTIYNVPIIGEFIEHKDDFGSHGGKIEISDEGIKFIKTTKAYGVVPESATVRWETINEGGVDHEYLMVDNAFLWTGRYEEASKIIEQGKAQSMEVEFPVGHFNKDKKFVADEMVFSALCILGDDVTPAFEGASISSSFALADTEKFRVEFLEMLSELKNYSVNEGGRTPLENVEIKNPIPSEFAEDPKKTIEIDNTKEAAVMEGSWGDVDKAAVRDELTGAANAGSLVKEGYLIVDADWKNAPSESLHYPHHVVKDGKLVVHKAGLEAAHARLMANDPHDEAAKAHLERHYKELGLDMTNFSLSEFSLTSAQLKEELSRILADEESFEDSWFFIPIPRYWYVDNIPSEGIVICEDAKNDYLIGVEFTVNGDVVTVNFDSAKRYKLEYVPMAVVGPDGDEAVTNKVDGDDFSSHSSITKNLKLFAEYMKKKKDMAENKGSTDDGGKEGKGKDPDGAADEEEIEEDLEDEPEENMSLVEFEQKIKSLELEIASLSEFKINKEKEERQKAEDELFARFSDQLNEEDLAELKSGSFSVEQLEEKIFAILGKRFAQFSMNSAVRDATGTVKVGVFSEEKPSKSGKPYANLIEKNRRK